MVYLNISNHLVSLHQNYAGLRPTIFIASKDCTEPLDWCKKKLEYYAELGIV